MHTPKEIENISEKIHKCYCRYYLKRYGHEYHTLGDYSKLDESTKDADREMAIWHLKEMEENQKMIEECVIAIKLLLEAAIFGNYEQSPPGFWDKNIKFAEDVLSTYESRKDKL